MGPTFSCVDCRKKRNVRFGQFHCEVCAVELSFNVPQFEVSLHLMFSFFHFCISNLIISVGILIYSYA